jgi:hypothetical protein
MRIKWSECEADHFHLVLRLRMFGDLCPVSLLALIAWHGDNFTFNNKHFIDIENSFSL